MKKNFLDELLLLLGNNPEKYMIEHSLFFSKDVVDTAFNEMLNYLQTGHHFIIRKSTKNAVVSPYRDVAGTLFWNNIYGTKILNNIIKLILTISEDKATLRNDLSAAYGV